MMKVTLRSPIIIFIFFWCIWGSKRPLDISFTDNKYIKLQTSITRFSKVATSPQNLPIEINVDLYSMLHVADLKYYKEIENRMREYDLILLELITSVNNSKLLLSNSDDVLDSPYKRILVGEIISPQAETLAKQLGLATQLSNLYLPNRLRRGWYIADLDAETIYELENKNRDKTASKYYLSRLFGRSFSEQLLKNFYLSDKVSILECRYC